MRGMGVPRPMRCHSRQAVIQASSSKLPMSGVPGRHFDGVTGSPRAFAARDSGRERFVPAVQGRRQVAPCAADGEGHELTLDLADQCPGRRAGCPAIDQVPVHGALARSTVVGMGLKFAAGQAGEGLVKPQLRLQEAAARGDQPSTTF